MPGARSVQLGRLGGGARSFSASTGERISVDVQEKDGGLAAYRACCALCIVRNAFTLPLKLDWISRNLDQQVFCPLNSGGKIPL